jgi:acyl dehydratase
MMNISIKLGIKAVFFFVAVAALLLSADALDDLAIIASAPGSALLADQSNDTPSNEVASSESLFYPGIYSQATSKKLEEINHQFDELVGWQTSGNTTMDVSMSMTADLVFMKMWANAADFWNPLFNNEEYANTTRYGGIIAAPFYKESGAMFPTLPADLENGTWAGSNDGGDIEFFLPIRPGDAFKTYAERSTVTDETPAEGSTTRTFAVTGSGSLYNQKGEKVLTQTTFGRNSYTISKGSHASGMAAMGSGPVESSENGKPNAEVSGTGQNGSSTGPAGNPFGSRHNYTEDDWALIHQIEDAEVVRGNNTLYWEDVFVADEPAWTIVGPTTTLDMIQFNGLGIINSPPMREQLKNKDELNGLKQDEYGVYHLMIEGHFSEAGMGGSMPIHFMAFGRSLMARLVTNWIGDDGWLSKFSWRNGDLANQIIDQVPALLGKSATGHGKVSDVLIAKGYVTLKYVDGNDHKVDLAVWTEDIDGTLCQAANATVILPSRSGS